jgi:hypothetical protein
MRISLRIALLIFVSVLNSCSPKSNAIATLSKALSNNKLVISFDSYTKSEDVRSGGKLVTGIHLKGVRLLETTSNIPDHLGRTFVVIEDAATHGLLLSRVLEERAEKSISQSAVIRLLKYEDAMMIETATDGALNKTWNEKFAFITVQLHEKALSEPYLIDPARGPGSALESRILGTLIPQRLRLRCGSRRVQTPLPCSPACPRNGVSPHRSAPKALR